MNTSEIDLAARASMNNALWCDAVCRAHGVATSFTADAWVGRGTAPPLYPNLVTLSSSSVEELLRLVTGLKASLTAPGWAVKDSFDVLDLTTLGFEPLFHAQWAAIGADRRVAADASSDLRVSRLDTAEGLARWVSAWSVGEAEAVRGVPILLPDLLEHPDTAFLSVLEGTEVVAGLVANRGAGVIGVSNLFVTEPRPPRVLSLGLAEIQRLWPDLPLVSYAPGDHDALEWRLGFRAFAGLTVWSSIRRAEST